MKRIFTFLLSICMLVFWAFYVNAQVTVTGSHASSNGNYTTLKAAFDAINAQPQDDNGIEIQISDNTTEAAAAVLNSGNWVYIDIYPTASGKSITGSIEGNGLIVLNGADNVSIDGRVNQDGEDADLTISNTLNTTVNNTSTIRFLNGACDNVVKYCYLKGATKTITSGIVFFHTSDQSEGNNNNSINYNNFTGVDDANRSSDAINSIGSTGVPNTGNVIRYNNFYNVLRKDYGSVAIRVASNSTGFLIKGNSIYETTEFVPTLSSTYYSILFSNTSGTCDIMDNFIGGSAPECGGVNKWRKTNAYSNGFNGIYISASAITTSNVTGNIIKKIDWKNSISAQNFNSIYAVGMINIGGDEYEDGNIIGDADEAASILFQCGGTVNGLFYGIYVGSSESSTAVLKNNLICGIETSHTNAANAVNFLGIYKSGEGDFICQNNTIGSTTLANSIITSSTSTSASQVMTGIYCAGTNLKNISGNLISNITNSATSNGIDIAYNTGIFVSSTGDLTVNNNTIRNLTNSSSYNYSNAQASVCGIGIAANGFSNTQEISGNTIFNLSNTNSSTNEYYVIGIAFAGSRGSGTRTISNNFIHSLSANENATSANIIGIRIQSGLSSYFNNIISLGGNTPTNVYGFYEFGYEYNDNRIFNNTVYIGGNPTTGTNKSYCLYSHSNENIRDFRNNILYNARSTTGGSNLHYAAYFNYANTANLTMDYNNLYSTGTGAAIGYLNSTPYSNLNDWKATTGLDAHSISNNPNFDNVGGTAAADYKVGLAMQGTTIDGFTTDFEGTTRNDPPTMGAFEKLILIIYVDAARPDDSGDGLSWANAKKTLQAALDLAGSGDQIWMKAGTYKPTTEVEESGTRYQTFQMKEGVAIYGGFAGGEDPATFDLADRDFVTNETILSGDLNGDDNFDAANGGYQGTTGDDNCYHVFYHPDGLGLTSSAVLDGFTITGGNANGSDVFKDGAGMYNNSSSPTLSNLIIKNNNSTRLGGGICCYNNSSPIMTNIKITNNTSNMGGGIFIAFYSSPILTNVLISNNSASTSGGGVVNDVNSSPTFNNVSICNNYSGDIGGGVTNATSSTLTLNNSIIWDNNAATSGKQIQIDAGTILLNYSCYSNSAGDVVNSGTFIPDANSITTNPLIVDATNNDFRLYGNSPCVNTGNNSYNSEAKDLRGQARIQNVTIDMGAYEWTDGTDPIYPEITSQPADTTIIVGNNASFFISAIYATSYQWQVNTGSGFVNLTNEGVYTGATTDSLKITGTIAGMNGYSYRCIVTGSYEPKDTSNVVTLYFAYFSDNLSNLYKTWSEAINGTLENGTISLLNDFENSANININNNLTLDLNGHIFSGTGINTIGDSKTLILTNGTGTGSFNSEIQFGGTTSTLQLNSDLLGADFTTANSANSGLIMLGDGTVSETFTVTKSDPKLSKVSKIIVNTNSTMKYGE